MKTTTIRHLAIAGTFAGVLMFPFGTAYLSSQKYNVPALLNELISVEEQLNKPNLSLNDLGGNLEELVHKSKQLNEKRQEILSNPDFERVKADYDSDNHRKTETALYFMLGGGVLALSSLVTYGIMVKKKPLISR